MKRMMTWKVAALFFAATTVLALWSPWENSPGEFPNEAKGTVPRGQADLMRQLRIPAGKLGIDEEELFASLLRAETEAQTIAIMKKIGHVASEQAFGVLEKFIHDRRRAVAAAAVHAIGHIGGDDATEILLALEKSERRLANAVIRALGAVGTDRGVERLFALAGDKRALHKELAVRALGEADVGGTTVLLRELLPTASTPMVRAITRSLSKLSDPEAKEMLRNLLTSKRATVRIAAIGVFDINSDEDAVMMMEALASADAATAEAAARSLGKSRRAIAVSLLLQTAQDAPQSVRRASITALGNIGGDQAREALAEALSGGNLNMSSQAAWALASNHDSKSIDVLVEFVKNGTGPGRVRALQALENVGGEQTDTVMLAALQGADTVLRGTAMRYLVRSDHPDGIVRALEIAQHGSRRSRVEAINALAQNDSPLVKSGLKELARTSTGAMRSQVLSVLARQASDDPELVELLVASMENGRSYDAHSLASSLAMVGTPAARDALVKALSSGGRQKATAAIYALGRMGGPEAMAALGDAARNGKREVKQAALQQLISGGDPSGLVLAKKALTDPEVAGGIVYALANQGSAEARSMLRDAAKNKSGSIRSAAVRALAQGGDARDLSLLEKMTRDDDAGVRSTVFSSIAQIGGERATQILLDSASNGDASARASAMSYLGSLDNARASRKLRESIGDDTPEVAVAAIYASSQMGSAADQELLSRALDENTPKHVRTAAARVLQQNGGKLAKENNAALTALVNPSGTYGNAYMFDH